MNTRHFYSVDKAECEEVKIHPTVTTERKLATQSETEENRYAYAIDSFLTCQFKQQKYDTVSPNLKSIDSSDNKIFSDILRNKQNSENIKVGPFNKSNPNGSFIASSAWKKNMHQVPNGLSYHSTHHGSFSNDIIADQLKFELHRREKINSELQKQITTKDITVKDLKRQIDELKNQYSKVELEKRSDKSIQETRLSAQLALKEAELDASAERNERLEQRFCEMEEILRQKDTELRTLQEQAMKRENEYNRLVREIQASQYENTVKNYNLVALETERQSKTEMHQQQCREVENNYKQQMKKYEVEYEYNTAKLYDKLEESHKQNAIQEKRIQELTHQTSEIKSALEASLLERDQLREKILDIETGYVEAKLKAQELNDLNDVEETYKDKLKKLEEKNFMLQNKLSLIQPIYDDNVALSYKNRKLQQKLYRSYIQNSNPPLSHHSNESFQSSIKHVLTDSSTPALSEINPIKTDRDDWANIEKWKLHF